MTNNTGTIQLDGTAQTFTTDIELGDKRWGALVVQIDEESETTVLRWANGSKELLTIAV